MLDAYYDRLNVLRDREVARHRGRFQLGQSRARRARRQRGRRELSQPAAVGQAGSDARRRQLARRRDRQDARQGRRGGSQDRGIPLQDQSVRPAPTTPRCRASSSPRSIRRFRPRAGRRPISRRAPSNCAIRCAPASRSNPPTSPIRIRCAGWSNSASRCARSSPNNPRRCSTSIRASRSSRRRSPSSTARFAARASAWRASSTTTPQVAGNRLEIADREPRPGQEAGLAEQRAGRAVARARARGQDPARLCSNPIWRNIARRARAITSTPRRRRRASFRAPRPPSSRPIRRNCRPC